MEYPVELSVTCPPSGGGPVTCGLPFPRGRLTDPGALAVTDCRRRPIPLQARVLNRWADGSVRWLLLDWRAEAGGAPYRLAPGGRTDPAGVLTVLSDAPPRIGVGVARFEFGGPPPFRVALLVKDGVTVIGVEPDGTTSKAVVALVEPAAALRVEDATGAVAQPIVTSAHIEEAGPLRAVVCQRGKLGDVAEFVLRTHHFAGSKAVRFEFTVRNPRRAEHPGGLWDLGDPGSVHLRDIAFTFALPHGDGPAAVACSPEVGAPFDEFAAPVELFQASSGGENWNHVNHVNRDGKVPLSFRGYRIGARSGLRATPIVALARGGHTVGVAVPKFWQNFPAAIEASADAITLRLYPRHADPMELQGGEQKTWAFAVAFGNDDLEWFRQPPLAFAPPQWYCDAGVIPHLTPRAADPNADYLALVDAAIEGGDTFDLKREKIDEYGWRHFGDIYGDHEAVYHDGPTAMASHYNNQYDPIAGFAAQFLRSANPEWFRHMDELAAHVVDIDIYHTDADKSAYNRGMFWHTYHYADADKGNHRAYPGSLRQFKGMPGLDAAKATKSRNVYALGGGPANEQNYATGLVLHHFLTGSEASREAAIELAQWVIDMDDGRKTIFRWLAGGDTGQASKSRDMSYHGPGRGSGNSLAALIDGHVLSGDRQFLDKAEQLVRRCIHPADDVPARDFLDVENKWFYTMFLQALGRYLDHKIELGELDRTYAYGRAVLLHYARWMADHEVPTLSRPEVLEYPNETWAAQDVRKCEVFQYAAKHAEERLKARFLERADFFFRDSIGRLSAFPTKTLCRPVVLLLSFGFSRAFFQKHPEESAPRPLMPVEESDFGTPERFEPQKVRAVRRAKQLIKAGAVVGAALVAGLAWWALR